MKIPPAWQAGAMGSLEVLSGSMHDSQGTTPHARRAMTMRELVAAIAHEVNQPLAAIVANADACLSWLGTEQPDLACMRKAAERIIRDGYRASAVLSSIHALFNVPSQAMSELDLNEVVRETFELMRNELNRYDVVLQVDLCTQLRGAWGNRIQLQQVLINLIKNAIESMSESVVRPLLVRVSTAIQGAMAMIAVEDSGSGFDAAAAERMFEPFFTTKREGTGVGLSICRSIVEAHGGILRATRKESAGSVFEFTVPLIQRPILLQN
jgi:C4-dicarboxylate-specific signal transduction histidine kinase